MEGNAAHKEEHLWGRVSSRLLWIPEQGDCCVYTSGEKSVSVMKTNVYKTDTNSVAYPVPMKKFAWLFDLVFSQKHTIVLCSGAF